MRAATTTPVEPTRLVARFLVGIDLPRYCGESASTLDRFEACSVFARAAARIARFTPLQGDFPRVLQVICHLLTRPGSFRLERESPGGTWYPRNPCTLPGHTQQCGRKSHQGVRFGEKEFSFCRIRRRRTCKGYPPLVYRDVQTP